MKRIVAVEPYTYKTGCNFKYKPWVAWQKIGGKTTIGKYPRLLHKLMFAKDFMPLLNNDSHDIRLCFTSPSCLYFDTWSSVSFHEIIPFLWDCWEQYDNFLLAWIKKHNIKTCIFTSRISQERICMKMPELKTFFVPEGIDVNGYLDGSQLKDRVVDYYHYGRIPQKVAGITLEGIKELADGNDMVFFWALKNSKVTIAVPRCDVVPCHETLTQRYWECMLSRMVMVGRSPKELIDLIGYDPVIPIDYEHYAEQIKDIVSHIEDYQELVDKNREVALRMAPWEIRMKQVMEWLVSLGYEV